MNAPRQLVDRATNRTVAVVYHSGRGHTAAQARAVQAGAASVAGVSALLLTVQDAAARLDDLCAAGAIIFGAPTYMGSVSAEMKAFMDLTSRQVYLSQRWKDKLAAGFTNSGAVGGDKLLSLFQLTAFAAQHSMLWVSLGLMASNNHSGGSPADLNRCGVWLGAAAQSHLDQPADRAPPEADLLTAQHLGHRVARLLLKFDLAADSEVSA